MDVCETKNMDLFNKVHIFEPMKHHIYETNISLISLMFSYAKPRILNGNIFECFICRILTFKIRHDIKLIVNFFNGLFSISICRHACEVYKWFYENNKCYQIILVRLKES